MSLQENNPFARYRQTREKEFLYPAEFHFRIIVDAQRADEAALGSALTEYSVTAPLAVSRHSSGGHYLAFSLSVSIANREELDALHATLKKVPGVRMVL